MVVGQFFWVYYRLRYYWPDIILGYLAFVSTMVAHEIGHGVGNGLTGGEFGFAGDAGNIIGSYGINSQFLGVIPVWYVSFADYGSYIVMLLAGPITGVLLGWFVATYWSLGRLRRRYPTRGWGYRIRRALMIGVLTRAWFDAIYMLPLDPFPEQPVHGDGMNIYEWFRDNGWHVHESVEVFETEFPLLLNPGYALGGLAIVLLLYVTYRAFQCTNLLCRACSVEVSANGRP